MTRFIWVVAAFAMLAAAGCNTLQPVYEVVDAPVVTDGKQMSMADVQRAIQRAGVGLGWQIKPVRPGQMTGQLDLRTHQALVDITHTTKSYSIKYRDSKDLAAKDGQIHRNYNAWVQNLDKAIRVQLLAP
jgi:hypothetical protein